MMRLSLAVVGLFCVLYLFPLGMRPMTVPDESRYSEIPREMIASGDWVVPRLNGVRYFEKPVLGYWVNAFSISLFGQNRFAVRLPAALSTGLTALMVFFLVRRFAEGDLAPLLAALTYLTCLMVFALGIINILDSLLTLFLTGAMVSFFYAIQKERGAKHVLGMALFGGFSGLAFLVKGFLAFAVPVVTVVPYMLWERRMTHLLKASWVPILAAVLVVLPWAVIIHLREEGFWNYFFWTEHIRRFLSPIPGQHPKPFWYFVPVLIGGLLPWAALIPAAVIGVRRRWQKEPFIRFLFCWFLFPFLFFSASSGKLIPYILPCFPPLAMFIAIGLMNYFKSGKRKAFDFGAWILGIILGASALGFVFHQLTGMGGEKIYDGSETLKWTGVALGLLVWSLVSILSTIQSDFRKKLFLFSAAPLLVYLCVHLSLPNRTLEGRAPQKLIERNIDKVENDAFLVSDEYLFHAVCWFFKRKDVRLLEKTGELTYGLKHAAEGSDRCLTLDELNGLIEQDPRPRVILIVEADRYHTYIEFLPEPLFEDRNNGVLFLVF